MLHSVMPQWKESEEGSGRGRDGCFLLNHRVIIITVVVFIIEYQFIHVNLYLVSSVVHACFFLVVYRHDYCASFCTHSFMLHIYVYIYHKWCLVIFLYTFNYYSPARNSC